MSTLYRSRMKPGVKVRIRPGPIDRSPSPPPPPPRHYLISASDTEFASQLPPGYVWDPDYDPNSDPDFSWDAVPHVTKFRLLMENGDFIRDDIARAEIKAYEEQLAAVKRERRRAKRDRMNKGRQSPEYGVPLVVLPGRQDGNGVWWWEKAACEMGSWTGMQWLLVGMGALSGLVLLAAILLMVGDRRGG